MLEGLLKVALMHKVLLNVLLVDKVRDYTVDIKSRVLNSSRKRRRGYLRHYLLGKAVLGGELSRFDTRGQYNTLR